MLREHYSLGLFLAQYLCNGFNLADAGELTYSQYYFDTGRKAFKFKRVKTTNRTEGGSEVIIPIIEPLQRILDEIAAEPVLNGFVFPEILQGATLKADKRKRISQENSNVQDRIIKICQEVLHWEVRPSGRRGADIHTAQTLLMHVWNSVIYPKVWDIQPIIR